jgi:hypothetical protein
VEPQQQGRTNQPAEQDAERASSTAKDAEMSTEISTQRASGLALATFDDAFRFAKMVAASDFAPKDFRGKPESCLLAIQHGSEVGLSPMQSLQSIACINGRPSVWGDAALALVIGSPVCEYVRETVDGEGDAMVATCEAKRRGYEQASVVRFSVADAKKAGLWGKTGPWQSYSRRMLQMRARSFALRDAFPDVLRGLVTAEEAQDYPETPAAVDRGHGPATVTQVVAQPPALTVSRESATPSPMENARLAVSAAGNLAALSNLRARVDKRFAEKVFTAAEHAELSQLLDYRAEMLIESVGGGDAGQEFAHEAAEHEVTA